MPVIGTAAGHLFMRQYQATACSEMTLPNGVYAIATAARPLACYARYRGRTYITGYFSRGLVWTEDWGLFPAGVRPPMLIPTLAGGGSSGGSTGENIGYVTFSQEKRGVVIQESNPSGPTNDGNFVSVTGQGFLWTNLPTVSVDPHVTHVNGYRSVDGAVPRLAWKRELASSTTSLSENVLTNDLGTELVTRTGLDNEVSVDVNARGVPPYCRIVTMYQDTAYWSGDPAHPDRIYPSNIFEPWAVNTSEDDGTFLTTQRGEAVVGMIEHPGTHELLVFCSPANVYGITGFGPDDRDMRMIPGGHYELLSHQSLKLVGPDADVYGACQEGTIKYNGTFQNAMRELESNWRDLVRADPGGYALSWAVEDRWDKGYKLRVPRPAAETNRTLYFFGCYTPTRSGADPWWTTDERTRDDGAACEVRPYGQPFAEIHTGSADGHLRKEHIATDGTDDSDTYDKAFDLIHGHLWLPDQEGDENHGSKVTNIDIYAVNQDDDMQVSLYAGDDQAAQAVASSVYQTTISASRLPSTERQRVAITSFHRTPEEQATGKGVSVRVTVANPVEVQYRGFSLYYVPGVPQRPFSE